MRKIIVALVLFLAVAFVILRFSELKSIAQTIQHSDLRFLLAALVIECLWMFNSATMYRSLYRLVGLGDENYRLLLVATAATFVNVVAPSVGIGGMAIFLDDAKRHHYSTGRVTVVGVLYVLFDYLAFLCVLALGWVVLIRRNNLNAGEITASLILLALSIAFALILFLGYRSSEKLGHVLAWMSRLVNRVMRPFIHRDYLKEDQAHAFANEVAEGVAMIRGKGRSLVWPFLFALNNFVLLICVLLFTFLAYETPFTAGTLVGGFSIGYLFLIVSPTPAGLGVVEGVLTVALNTLRVNWAAAALITLTYRAVTFWFPMVVGAVAFRVLSGQNKQQVA
jgi:glycosyltransferase 2 family protein